jgi:hypothetical protein
MFCQKKLTFPCVIITLRGCKNVMHVSDRQPIHSLERFCSGKALQPCDNGVRYHLLETSHCLHSMAEHEFNRPSNT